MTVLPTWHRLDSRLYGHINPPLGQNSSLYVYRFVRYCTNVACWLLHHLAIYSMSAERQVVKYFKGEARLSNDQLARCSQKRHVA